MTPPTITPSQVRYALLLRDEIALLDLRHEAAFATGHPLFAANMAADRISLEAETRLPRKDVPIVVYDAGDGLVAAAADRLTALGYTNVCQLDGGLKAWQAAGYELFQDVNSYAKAFGELVESRRHTPSLSADEVASLIKSKANIAILDVRRRSLIEHSRVFTVSLHVEALTQAHIGTACTSPPHTCATIPPMIRWACRRMPVIGNLKHLHMSPDAKFANAAISRFLTPIRY